MAIDPNRRFMLQDKLELILGSNKVYYNPPDGQKISYPCIIYNLEGENVDRANNARYRAMNRYSITIIHRDADSTICNDILDSFEYTSFNRQFKNDNLYHDVITLYY